MIWMYLQNINIVHTQREYTVSFGGGGESLSAIASLIASIFAEQWLNYSAYFISLYFYQQMYEILLSPFYR